MILGHSNTKTSWAWCRWSAFGHTKGQWNWKWNICYWPCRASVFPIIIIIWWNPAFLSFTTGILSWLFYAFEFCLTLFPSGPEPWATKQSQEFNRYQGWYTNTSIIWKTSWPKAWYQKGRIVFARWIDEYLAWCTKQTRESSGQKLNVT